MTSHYTPEAALIRARVYGHDYAEGQQAANGELVDAPTDSPLSGEWADAPTMAEVWGHATGRAYPEELDEGNGDYLWDLCTEFEAGYAMFWVQPS